MRRATGFLLAGIGLAAAVGAWAVWWGGWGRYEAGGMRINPRAALVPGKTYVLRFWDVHLPPSPDGRTHADWVREALVRFRAAFPNIEVEHRSLAPDNALEELAASLRAGSPPDVLALPPGSPLLLSRSLQIPADFYAGRGERAAYLPAAWEAVTLEGRTWAWPQWLAARTWMGSRSVLAGSGVRFPLSRLWRADLAALAAVLADRPAGAAGLAVHPGGDLFLQDVLAASGWPVPVEARGARLWPREPVAAVLAWTVNLRDRQALVAPDPARTDDRFRDLLEGRLAILAGANPWLTTRLMHLDGKGSAPGLVLMPVPALRGEPFMPVAAGAMAIFRQRAYQGDDHTRAAAELARFLSRVPPAWVLPDSPLLPAYGPAWAEWMMRSRPEHRWLFGHGLARTRSLSPATPEEQASRDGFISAALQPALDGFWAGRAAPEQLAERIGAAPVKSAKIPWWRKLIPWK